MWCVFIKGIKKGYFCHLKQYPMLFYLNFLTPIIKTCLVNERNSVYCFVFLFIP